VYRAKIRIEWTPKQFGVRNRTMPSQQIAIDFVAYDREGRVVLLAEAKNRRGTSEQWAAGLRRNMLAHGVLPRTEYFLIVTPERMEAVWGERSGCRT